MGHEIHVISASTNHQRREYFDGTVHVIRIPGFYDRISVNTEPVSWLTYSVAVAIEVADLHSKKPLDLLDFPEWGGEGYVHLLNRTEWNYIPVVIQIHGPLVMFAHAIGWPSADSEYYRVGTAMESTSLRLADGIFSSSACSADWCATHYGLDRARIPVLHTGIDTRLFSPRDTPKEQRPTIIFVGRVSADKGASALVEAACTLAGEFPDLQLRILGRGEPCFVEELRQRASARGWHGLHFVGFVNRTDLPLHLSRAHVFAGPSTHEPGPGLAYLEAMACGLPVVACASAGATEVVHHGQNGLLVPPGDAGALAQALRELLLNPQELQAMGQRARAFVVQNAESNTCVARIEAFYRSVVDRRSVAV
jgi:glycosyltransferase involved in cell wall biosynthesis